MRTIEGTRAFDKTPEEDRNLEERQIHSKCRRCCKRAPGSDRREDSNWYKTPGVACPHHANLDQILPACSETEPCVALRVWAPCNQSVRPAPTGAGAPRA